jgi:hypothetical protein
MNALHGTAVRTVLRLRAVSPAFRKYRSLRFVTGKGNHRSFVSRGSTLGDSTLECYVPNGDKAGKLSFFVFPTCDSCESFESGELKNQQVICSQSRLESCLIHEQNRTPPPKQHRLGWCTRILCAVPPGLRFPGVTRFPHAKARGNSALRLTARKRTPWALLRGWGRGLPPCRSKMPSDKDGAPGFSAPSSSLKMVHSPRSTALYPPLCPLLYSTVAGRRWKWLYFRPFAANSQRQKRF